MFSTKRRRNDVDFTADMHSGNEFFRTLIRQLIQQALRSSTKYPLPTVMDNHIRDSSITQVKKYVMSLDPPGRFLKNHTSRGGSYFVLHPEGEAHMIACALQTEWKEQLAALAPYMPSTSLAANHNCNLEYSSTTSSSSNNNNNNKSSSRSSSSSSRSLPMTSASEVTNNHNDNNNNNDFRTLLNNFQQKWNPIKTSNVQKQRKTTNQNVVTMNINDVDFTSAKTPGNDNFYILVRTLVEQGTYVPGNPIGNNELVWKFRIFLNSLTPPGRFLKQVTEVVKVGKSSHVRKVYVPMASGDIHGKVLQALSEQHENKNHMDMARLLNLWKGESSDHSVGEMGSLSSSSSSSSSTTPTTTTSHKERLNFPVGTPVQAFVRGEVVGHGPQPGTHRIRCDDLKYQQHQQGWQELLVKDHDLQRCIPHGSEVASSAADRASTSPQDNSIEPRMDGGQGQTKFCSLEGSERVRRRGENLYDPRPTKRVPKAAPQELPAYSDDYYPEDLLLAELEAGMPDDWE